VIAARSCGPESGVEFDSDGARRCVPIKRGDGDARRIRVDDVADGLSRLNRTADRRLFHCVFGCLGRFNGDGADCSSAEFLEHAAGMISVIVFVLARCPYLMDINKMPLRI
jgi:hypothetical protein